MLDASALFDISFAIVDLKVSDFCLMAWLNDVINYNGFII
jgi:hypothetical protein